MKIGIQSLAENREGVPRITRGGFRHPRICLLSVLIPF
jgi:hypothetical protein